MAGLGLPTSTSRADRFCYPEPLQPLTTIDINSKWRNKFIGAWTDRNAVIADRHHFPEIVEKAVAGILQEAATLSRYQPGKEQHSPDDIAAELREVQNSAEKEVLECVVRLYTYESGLYRLINHTLRNEDMSKVNTLGAFCFLLQLYIFNSPQDTIMDDGRKCDTVYRMVAFETEEDREKEIIKCEKKLGQTMTWLGFTSSSKDLDEAKIFMKSDDKKYPILYIINIASSKHVSNRKVDISSISSKPWEKEVLFLSGYEFNIDKVQRGQTTTINMSS